jgi:hypothetical protein
MNKPCKTCPFSRTVEPGALGGSPIHVYLGQIQGKFWLPCHSQYAEAVGTVRDPHCVGASIMRANLGINPSPALPTEGKNTEIVFNDLAEFAAHHFGGYLTTQEVRQALTPEALKFFLDAEIRRGQGKMHILPTLEKR